MPDPATGELITRAEVAETPCTAFASRPKREQVSCRLIVRRIPERNRAKLADGQGELFPLYRHHALITDSGRPLVQAEAEHRGHAVVEQVFADLKASALAHMPSGGFNANAAWLVCAAIAFNLARAVGVLAGGPMARAETATIRARIINIPARAARSARRTALHLPKDWLWATSWAAAMAAHHDHRALTALRRPPPPNPRTGRQPKTGTSRTALRPVTRAPSHHRRHMPARQAPHPKISTELCPR